MAQLKIAHRIKKFLRQNLRVLGQISRGIGWFISDIKFNYIMSHRHSYEQCSSCFGILHNKGENAGGFDYQKRTYYVCKNCYDKGYFKRNVNAMHNNLK